MLTGVPFLHTLHQADALLQSSDAAKDIWTALSQPTAWVIDHLIKLLPL
jgi:predicted DCC family thiol-disulfide oxidoreductase YuxK